MEKLKIIRHIEEQESNFDFRNSPINNDEVNILKDYYIPEIITDIESGKYNNVTIISSDKLRSTQTSEILKNEIAKHSGIPINNEVDDRSSPQFHGIYRPGLDSEDYRIEMARSIYIKETFEKGNVWYRYGDSKSDTGESLYPEMDDIFSKPGENQIELNIRMYGFCLDLLDRVEQDPSTLFILSTHYLTMSRFLALEAISKAKSPFGLFIKPGELYKEEWDTTKEIVKESGYKEFFKEHNYVFNVDLSKLDEIRGSITSELCTLLDRYEQHYEKTN